MRKLTDEQKIEIVKLYQSGVSSLVLGKQFNVSSSNIRILLKNRGIKRRKSYETARKDHFNEQYFDVIDNENRAYWLGFIFGDGSVNNGGLSFILSCKDIAHLNKLSKDLSSNRLAYLKTPTLARIDFSSKYLAKSLNNIGIIPNKTYDCINLPKINHNLMPHFIRGYLDADGWFCKISRKTFYQLEIGLVCHKKEIIEQISEWFQSIGINTGYISCKHQASGDNWQYAIRGYENFSKIISVIYNKPNVYLDRKYTKIKSFITEFNLGLEI